MRKIIIIGAGFAGLSAAKRLSRSNLDLQITVFDKRDSSDFLPLLPDVPGRGLNPDFLACKITDLLRKKNLNFIKEEVISLDLESKQVITSGSSYVYDFLVIASGSQTNFFGNQDAQNHAYALNSVNDAKRILNRLHAGKFENLIICGGGYTGIEAASNLRLYCRKNGIAAKIVIVERAPEILGPLPDWMKSYVRTNLKGMEIEVLANSVIESIQESRLVVSGNRIFEKTMLFWVPGVRTADFIQRLAVEKNPQGRIVVDGYLKFGQDCFCAGDTAFFTEKNNSLRMAVQFAIAGGDHAAFNIIRRIKNLPLKKFIPRDLGYIIPMANNKSCGTVFGFNLKGFLPTLLHFIMCIYRLSGLRNKIGLTGDLTKKEA
ncbi:MAG: FAD-dependent oxidoreductase [Candidatus Omnitrophica bacterium]|nr:FAD-dependent oxidoreductase [Candidatus Omnitrophota bacterium]